MKNRKTLLGVAVAVVCGIVGIVALGGGSTVAAVSFGKVREHQGTMQVYGALDKGSIRNLRGANLVAFDLVDDKTKQRLSVLYDNPGTGLPVNFPSASHVRVTGIFDPTQNLVVADRVFTKCPSKDGDKGKQQLVYGENVEQDKATQEALKRWKAATGQKMDGT